MTDPTTRPWIRSYAARRGRHSALTARRLEDLSPRYVLPESGTFADSFGRKAPLVLEIGCGHGAAAIAYAAAHPGHDVLAVDVHTPGIARMMAAAAEAGVDNLRVHHGDAVLLLADRVAPASLAAIHLFFPDPWPKAKHAKRRFVTDHTLGLIHDRLVDGGQLLIATDQDLYAEHALAELAAFGRFAVSTGQRPDWRPTDGFEKKGRAAGRSISEICAVRVGAVSD